MLYPHMPMPTILTGHFYMHPGGGKKTKQILPHGHPHGFFQPDSHGEFPTLISTRQPGPLSMASPGCLLLAKVFKMPGMRVVLTISKPTVLRPQPILAHTVGK